MPEDPNPPPLPRRVEPLTPLPVVPIHPPAPPPPPPSAWPPPVSALPTQWPTADPTLSYRSPVIAKGTRPGLLTALGVISIIIASLSLLGGAVSVVMLSVVRNISAMATNAGAAVPVPTLPAVPQVAPRGFDASTRQIVIDGLMRKRPLDASRQLQIDALLTDSGRDLFPIAPELLNEQVVAQNVSQSGRLMSSSGADFFVIATGRLEVSGTHAVFFPADGRPAIRVANGEASGTGASSAGLTYEQIEAVVQKVDGLVQNQLTEAQRQAIRAELSQPSQLILNVDPTILGVTGQIHTAQLLPDGAVLIYTNNAVLEYAKDGVRNSMPGIAPGAGKLSSAAMGGVVAETLLSLALAALLMTAGICTLRQSSWGRRLHLIYALSKIPVVILGVWAWHRLASDGILAFSRQAAQIDWGQSIFLGVLLCIYPIALLIVLHTPEIRKYYSVKTV